MRKILFLASCMIAAICCTAQTTTYNDVICLDAKGPVASIEETSIRKYNLIGEGETEMKSTTVYIFDEEGRWVKINDFPVTVVRDAKKRPKTISYTEIDPEYPDEEPNTTEMTFTYTPANYVSKIECTDIMTEWGNIYRRDATGKVTSIKNANPFEPVVTKCTYPAGSIDEKGNWTKCIQTCNGEKTTVTRKITYRN